MNDIIAAKRKNSEEKISALQEKLSKVEALDEIPDLAIFVAGSYARNEASPHSDIDLFFILDGKLEDIQDQNIKCLRAFSRIIDEADALGFPKFSNDGEFLQILEKPKMELELGGRDDDHLNYFTARMLMLIEGKAVYGINTYENILRETVSAYFRDYTHHPKDFKPVFLINDIIRFWKTLCLNYEHKRNQPEQDQERKIKQKVKNFKLKFSRMMTCYGSIISIVSEGGNSGPHEVISLSQMSPYQRLSKAVSTRPGLNTEFGIITEEYGWFLEQTNVSELELLNAFRERQYRELAFERAERFGDAMFQVTRSISEETGYLRYLLI